MTLTRAETAFRRSHASVEWGRDEVRRRDQQTHVRDDRLRALSSEDRERVAEDALDNGPGSAITSAKRFAPRRLERGDVPGGNGPTLLGSGANANFLLSAGRPGAPSDPQNIYAPFVGGVTVNSGSGGSKQALRQEDSSRVLGSFFLNHLGFFLPFMVPGMLPMVRQLSKGLPPPFDYLINVMAGTGSRGLAKGPTKKAFHTCAPRAPPPFSKEPPPAPPLFPVITHMPDWSLLTPGMTPGSMLAHGYPVGPEKTHPDEPDSWRQGDVHGRFTGRSAVGRVVDKYPTQGVQYPFSSGATPATEPLAHLQSPALLPLQQPAIWLALGGLPPASPLLGHARAVALERLAWQRRRDDDARRRRGRHQLHGGGSNDDAADGAASGGAGWQHDTDAPAPAPPAPTRASARAGRTLLWAPSMQLHVR